MLSDYVPKDLFERPKMGFGVPKDQWLRESLKAWAGDLLDPSKLKREGYFNPSMSVVSGRHIFQENLIINIICGIF